jgi:hypothetical protein
MSVISLRLCAVGFDGVTRTATGARLSVRSRRRVSGSRYPASVAEPSVEDRLIKTQGGPVQAPNNETSLLFAPEEAFYAMSAFLWDFVQRAGDDLVTLLGDTEILEDGGPTDPAAWEDWLACIERVRSAKPLRPSN